jgi:hypothetical protein
MAKKVVGNAVIDGVVTGAPVNAAASPAPVKKEAVKKVAAKSTAPVKKVATKKAAAKLVKKESAPRATRTDTTELQNQILKFMKKGHDYSSREIVVGLGRTPGGKEGGPVVNHLKLMVEDGRVAYGSTEGKRGNVWVKQ